MRGEIFLQGLIGFLIVAFGQPSFAPWLGPVAAFAGYTLFWRAISIYPFRLQRFWRSSVWFAAASLIQLSWMSSIEYQGIYILFVWAALAVWLGIQFGLLTLLIPYNQKLSLPRILAMASLWTLLEWSRYHVLCGYSWNLSGMALSQTYAIQFASVFGVLGLSFWVILTNLVGLHAILRKGLQRYLTWVAIGCFPYLFGAVHIAYHTKQQQTTAQQTPFTCILVQTGLLPSEKVLLTGRGHAFISAYDQWKRILTFVKEQQIADLIVLPEAAVPYSSNQMLYEKAIVDAIFHEVFETPIENSAREGRVSNMYWAQTLSSITGSEIVLGLDHSDQQGVSYNSAFHLRPQGDYLSRYDKRVLMPLAEYLPFAFLLPMVENYGVSSFFTPGKAATLFNGKLPMSTSICYEETFPSFVRQGRLAGAKLLVNVTNDGWYPYSRLPKQHFDHGRVRAVENGVALIRACNTGVSGAIDALGRPINILDPYDQEHNLLAGAVHASFVPYEYPTLYMVWGNWGILVLSSAILLFFVAFKKTLRL